MDGDLGAVGLPAAVAEHGVDGDDVALAPHVDPSRPAHGHGGHGVERMPAPGVVGVVQGRHGPHVVGRPGCGCRRRCSALDPGRKPAQIPSILRHGAAPGGIGHGGPVGCSPRRAPRGGVGRTSSPACGATTEPGHQAAAGHVVDEQVQRRALDDLGRQGLGQRPPQVAAAAGADQRLDAGTERGSEVMLRIRRSSSRSMTTSSWRSTTGSPSTGVSRSRARPCMWKARAPTPGPGGQQGAGAPHRAGPTCRRARRRVTGTEGHQIGVAVSCQVFRSVMAPPTRRRLRSHGAPRAPRLGENVPFIS